MLFRTALLDTCFLLGVTSGMAANAVDVAIEKVESGLLPTATTRIGATASILERMKDYGVPGVSVAVIDKGRVAWVKGYGVADSRTGTRVTPETLFQAASISKPLTALAALVLVEQGKLSLDEDVNRYLKSWKVPENELTRSQKVTLRMLLSHTAGVGDDLPVTIVRTPGSSHAYSKAGYTILQQLLIDAGENSFETVVRSAVFDPLGMKHSSFEPQRDRAKYSFSIGHMAGGNVQPEGDEIVEKAAAGLWSTPSDLARYLIAIQKARKGERGALLGVPLAAAMLTPQKGFHGLGPVISGSGATARFGHDGFNPGFESSMVGYIDRGQGAVVMANSNFAFALIIEILDSIARTYGWENYDSTNMWPPDAPLAQQAVLAIPPELVDASVGSFRSDSGQTMTLFRKGDRLFLELPIEGEAEVYAARDGSYFCPQMLFSDLGSPWMRFDRDDQGIVRSVRAGYRAFARFQRVD